MDWDETSELGGEPAADTKAPDSPKGGGEGNKGSDEVAALRAQIEGLTKKQAELEAANAYWERRLGAGSRAADPDDDQDEEPEGDDAGETEDDGESAFDAFSKKGIEALVKRGVLTKKDAKALIEKQARKIVREVVTKETEKLRADGELYDKYPDLKNLDSEHAKLTAQYFQAAIRRDKSAATSSWALEMAAARAKAELDAQSASKRREEPEARRRRIAVQSPGGDSWGSGGDDLLDDGPSPAQLALAGKLGFSAEEARTIISSERKRR